MIGKNLSRKSGSHVTKSSGEFEPFSIRKLQRSLRRTGLKPKYCKKITDEVVEKIHPGIKTLDIYRQTYNLIRRQSPQAAIRYSLKKSIQELGPTGFIFEKFVAKYFEAIGYETSTGAVLQGEYVRHEVDVIGIKSNNKIYAECKFHNAQSRKNDIKVALYVKARWDDLKKGPDGKNLREYYLVSNTSFTLDAITYAKGTGLKLLGVNAPKDESFLDKIEKHKLYPITSLKKLKRMYCQELLRENLILCTDLLNNKSILFKIGMSEEEIKSVYKDIHKITG